MRRSLWLSIALGACFAACIAQAQTTPTPTPTPTPPPVPGIPPGDEGVTRSALSTSLVALAYPYLNKRAAAMAGLGSADDARKRQDYVRQAIMKLIGGLPARSALLNARVTRTSQGEGFREENIVFDSLPGLHVTANLYLPEKAGRVPAIVAFPGHGPSGKLSYYSFGVFMARQGIAVLAIDLPGEGERVQYFDPATGKSRVGPSTGEHGMDAFAVEVTGDHVARYFINDGIGAIDYLAGRADIDAANIGLYGCSGGGTVAAYVGGIDTRVKAVAVACYMNDFAHLLPVQGPQEAEQTIPDFIPSGLDLPDWMELAAPRKYAVISTTEDMFPFTGAQAAYAEGRAFWGLLGKPDNIVWIFGPGGHGHLGPLQDRIADFFHDALGGHEEGPRLPPPPFRVPDDWLPRLQVTGTGQVSTSLGGETIQSVNAAQARQTQAAPAIVSTDVQAQALTTKLSAAVRDLAAMTAGASAPPVIEEGAVMQKEGLVIQTLSMESQFGLLPAALVGANPALQGPVMLLIEDGAFDPQSHTVRALVQAGWQVLTIHPRGADGVQRGESDMIGDQNRLALRAFIAGRTLPGIRADDLIAMINWLQSKGILDISLMATGGATVPAAHVAVIDDRVHGLILKDGLVSWRNAVALPMQRNLPPALIPGALRVYDLPDLITATRACTVIIADPEDGLGKTLSKAEAAIAYAHASAWLNRGKVMRLRIVTGAPELSAGSLNCASGARPE